MNKRIISSVLIYCILIQLTYTYTGCTSLYPVSNNNPALSDYEGELLLKLKDKRELHINTQNAFYIETPSNLFYCVGKEYNFTTKKLSDFKGIIERDKIDSSEVKMYNLNNVTAYWLNDNRKISCEKELYSITPDSGAGYWLALDNSNYKVWKVFDREIQYIFKKETNVAATVGLVVVSALVLGLLIFSLTWEGINLSGTRFN